jgi:NhaA family Na+:H+ antiporter
MVVPAAVYLATVWASGGSPGGWAVPMATDIAFALAVLAVISTHLPAGLRAFLLTLVVVDDLGAILVIAVFFTAGLNLWALAAAFAGLGVFYLLQRNQVRGWWRYLLLGVTIWALVYNSGVHATVAGVAVGLILRTQRDQAKDAALRRPRRRVSGLRICCGRSRPGSRSRSRYSPPESASPDPRSARCSPSPNLSASSSASSRARRSGCSRVPT